MPLPGHPSFWFEVTASPHTETKTKSRAVQCVLNKIPPNWVRPKKCCAQRRPGVFTVPHFNSSCDLTKRACPSAHTPRRCGSRRWTLFSAHRSVVRAAPSVEIDMESPDALKAYLDVEGIEHDGTMPIEHLKILVTRRQKRRARERGLERSPRSPSSMI